MICGSYRRGLPSSGDIDVLLMHEDYTSDMPAKKKGFLLRDVVEALEESNLITDTISLGDHKFMGVCRFETKKTAFFIHAVVETGFLLYAGRLPTDGSDDDDSTVASRPFRRLDIMLLPKDQFYCGVLYFTGVHFDGKYFQNRGNKNIYINIFAPCLSRLRCFQQGDARPRPGNGIHPERIHATAPRRRRGTTGTSSYLLWGRHLWLPQLWLQGTQSENNLAPNSIAENNFSIYQSIYKFPHKYQINVQITKTISYFVST